MTQIDPTVAVVDTPKLGRKRDHTRDPEILDAALDVLAESGYERMTIDMVATRAKAGKATLYRRWASKAELVIDAVACMKNAGIDLANLPDTGTLRGDLLASIKPPSIEDGDRKIHVMAGLMSMISCDPGLWDAVQSAIVEPRASANRLLLQRAIDRGEIPADCDTEKLSLLVTSMAMYRTMVQRKSANREFLISVIDELLLPAVGLHP